MAKKTGPNSTKLNVPGGTKENLHPHTRMAMGEKITGQQLKRGGKVEKERSRGGRGC